MSDLARSELAREIGEANLEHHAALGPAHRPDERVDVAGVGRRERRDLFVDLGARHFGGRDAAAEEDEIGHVGMGGQRVSGKRGRGGERADRTDPERIVGEGANIGPRRGKPGEESRQEARGLLGIGRIGQSTDEPSSERRIAIARRRAEGAVRGSRKREEMPRKIGRRQPSEGLDRRGGNR